MNAAGKIYVSGHIEIDTSRVVIRRGGEERSLRPKTFRLLVYLVEHRDRLVPKEELMEQLWAGVAVSDGALAQCISDIRRALDEDSRNPRFIRTAARLGYQFVGPLHEKRAESVILEEITEERIEYIEEITEEHEPAVLDRAPRALLPAPRTRDFRLFSLLIVFALVVAGALAAWRYWQREEIWTAEPGIRTAIVQFENRSGAPEVDWLRAGLPDMLATSLSGSPRMALITPGQLQRGSGRNQDPLQTARRVGAKAMITGAFASLGESIRVDAQIYDVSTGRLVGGESLTVERAPLLLAQMDPFANRLATRLGAPFTGQHLAEVMTDNLEAYRLYSLGLERTRNFRLPEAVELYEKAVALDPQFAMAYARTGITYASTWHRPAEGKPYLEKAFRLSQRLTPRDRLFIRAWYAVACEDYEAAERAYRQILSAYPLEVEVYHALGVLLEQDAKYNEAIQMYQRGLAIEPDMPQLHNQLSGVYLELGQKNEAVERAHRYLALSGEPNAYDTLALTYYGTGDYAKARETYLEAIRRKPDFGLALVHLGNLYVQLGRYREALAQYREYIRLGPSYVERCRGHLSCSWAYWKKGDLQNAEQEAAAATRENHGQEPRDILPIKADRGGFALTDQLRHSILGEPAARGPRKNQRMPFFLVGYVALRDHKTDEALDLFHAALGEHNVYWWFDPLETCLADALLELGRVDEAIAEYKRVLSKNPNYPMARYRLGVAFDRKGLRRDAREEFQRFLTIWQDADGDVPELIDARRRIVSGA